MVCEGTEVVPQVVFWHCVCHERFYCESPFKYHFSDRPEVLQNNRYVLMSCTLNSWNVIVLESGLLANGKETLNCSKVFSNCSDVSIKLKVNISCSFPSKYQYQTSFYVYLMLECWQVKL